ncbi:MAG: TolC family protein [Gallionellaceae bacterium]
MSMPSVGDAAGLGELLHQLEKNAPQLHVASARANALAAGIRVAKSQYWGHAEVLGQSTHYNTDRLVNPTSYPPILSRSQFDKNTYGFGAAFTLPMDIDGRITAKVNAQKYFSQAAFASVKQSRLSLFGQAVSLYRGMQRLEGVKLALHEQHKGHGKNKVSR